MRGLNTLPPGTKIDVWIIIKPVSEEVNKALQTGLIPITDENTRLALQGILTTIQTALAVIQLTTGG
jgi:hypothetical protein